MSLNSILRKPVAFELPALPSLELLERKKNAILNRWPNVVAEPAENDRERLVQQMLMRLNGEWDDTPLSLVTSAACAVFDAERRERADLSTLRDFYYAEIEASKRSTFLNSMLSIYLGTYEPGATHTRRLASALGSALAKAPPRIGAIGRQLFVNVPALLDPVGAPTAIAQKMIAMDDCWNELKAIGLRTPHAPGVMDHAHLAFVAAMAPTLKSRTAIEKLFDWLKPAGHQARMSGAGEAITAVLEPWLHHDPLASDLSFMTESLLGLNGDPRVSSGGAWAGVPASHLDTLMRWLTGENIRFFLDVVSAVESNHMWEPRREFWLSLHKQKRIDAAWVAFGESGVAHAERKLGVRSGAIKYGRQIARGRRKDTSLLIMKFGNKVLVEGSHDYAVQLFIASNKNIPKLYNPTYHCDYIRERSDDEYPHYRNKWKAQVLEQI